MSLSVRYPSGLAVHYNDAHFLRYLQSGVWEVWSADPDKGGTWIASIQASSGAIIEAVRPCRTEFEALTIRRAAEFLARHPDELRRLDGWVVSKVKRALANFNSRSRRWR